MLNLKKHGFEVAARSPQIESSDLSDHKMLGETLAQIFGSSWAVFKDCQMKSSDEWVILRSANRSVKVEAKLHDDLISFKVSLEIMALGFQEMMLNTDVNSAVHHRGKYTKIHSLHASFIKVAELLKKSLIATLDGFAAEFESVHSSIK